MTTLEFSQDLIVPHMLRRPYETPQLLVAMVDPEAIKDELQMIDSIEDYEESVLAATEFITAQVRETLLYPEKTAERNDFETYSVSVPVDLGVLREKQVADCFGFTIVSSELMDEAGIEHWVGFVNGHSVILLPTEEGKKLHLVDPLSPAFGQDLQFSMVSDGSFNDDMAQYGKSAIELNTLTIAQRAKGNTQEQIDANPWLVFKRNPGNTYFTPVDDSDRSFDRRHYQAFMSVYRPVDGRNMLQNFNKFELAYKAQDYLGAAACITRLGGSFPDVDARREHPDIKKIVTELAKDKNPRLARLVLQLFFESFNLISDDSRFHERYGDYLRVVARDAKDAESAQQAVDEYDTALTFPNAYHATIEAKIGKAGMLLAQLEQSKS